MVSNNIYSYLCKCRKPVENASIMTTHHVAADPRMALINQSLFDTISVNSELYCNFTPWFSPLPARPPIPSLPSSQADIPLPSRPPPSPTALHGEGNDNKAAMCHQSRSFVRGFSGDSWREDVSVFVLWPPGVVRVMSWLLTLSTAGQSQPHQPGNVHSHISSLHAPCRPTNTVSFLKKDKNWHTCHPRALVKTMINLVTLNN